jgi:hypothetical protein
MRVNDLRCRGFQESLGEWEVYTFFGLEKLEHGGDHLGDYAFGFLPHRPGCNLATIGFSAGAGFAFRRLAPEEFLERHAVHAIAFGRRVGVRCGVFL